MEQENVFVNVLRLVESFIQKVMHFSYFKGIQQVSKIDFDFFFFIQLSLPTDVVSLTYSCEKLLKTEVNDLVVLEHLSQLLKDVKSLQVISLFVIVLWVSSSMGTQEGYTLENLVVGVGGGGGDHPPFMTKISKFPYPICYQTKNVMP